MKRDNNLKQMQEEERIKKMRYEPEHIKKLRLENAKARLKMLDDMLKGVSDLSSPSKK
jgi:hypothetical protein